MNVPMQFDHVSPYIMPADEGLIPAKTSPSRAIWVDSAVWPEGCET